MASSKEWFENWFDTKWYHVLYEKRSLSEAQYFIENLIVNLQPKKESLFLDAACGAGRHSIILNELGFHVEGFDLSLQSIQKAKKHENHKMKFHVADLRNFQTDHKFDYIFSLFTSFGYFKNSEENMAVLKNFKNSLKVHGVLVLDFLNSWKVKEALVFEEEVEKEGVIFHIKRRIQNGVIVKDISFQAEGKQHSYEERVNAFSKNDFEIMFNEVGFKIERTFGDYNLTPFSEERSPRLIMIIKPIL